MINILLITDQPRLHGIFAACSSQEGVRLHTVNSLEAAAQEIAAAEPSVIFLQDRLSGLSGDIVSRHIRNRLGDSKAVIVFLSDDADSPLPKLVDHMISLAKSDDLVAKEVLDYISRIEKSGATEEGFEESGGEIADKVSDSVTISSPSIAAAETPVETVAEPETSEPSPFQEKLATAIDEHDPVAVRFADNEILSAELARPISGKALQGERVADLEIATVSSKKPVWIYAVISAVAIAGLLYLTLGRNKQAPKVPLQPAVQSIPAAPKLTKLPSFIPAGGLDSLYEKSHQGWRRYADPGREYKVFSDGGAIRAVQIIDRSGKGISTQFIEQVLLETTGRSAYTISGTTVKGNYEVEKGTVEKTAKIIKYKNKSDRQIRGFVVNLD